MGESKPVVLLLGKLPPPYFGPAIACKVILGSELKDRYQLHFYDVTVNKTLEEIGKKSTRKLFQNITLYIGLVTALRKLKADVIIIPISQETIGFLKDSIFILLASMARGKVLIQLRGSNFRRWYSSRNPFLRAYVRMVLKKASGVIVLGHSLRHLFRGFFPENKIHVVPNGANYLFPEPSKAPGEPLNILYFGNLLESKGIADVIEALSKRDLKGDYMLNLAGSWYDSDFKDQCIKKLEMHNIPYRQYGPTSGSKKFQLLADADIFIFPPRMPEGHPWVIIEAMAAGLPILTTDQGAIKESVKDGINGYIVPVADCEILSEKIVLLLEDESLRTQMGRQSRKLYLENFTEEKLVENYSKVINAFYL